MSRAVESIFKDLLALLFVSIMEYGILWTCCARRELISGVMCVAVIRKLVVMTECVCYDACSQSWVI